MTLLVICLHHKRVLLLYSSCRALVPSSSHDLTTSSPTTEQDPALDNAHVVLGQIRPDHPLGVRNL